jgi:thiol reductant ABC exporter CydD subunit
VASALDGLAIAACVVVQAVLIATVVDRTLLHGASLDQLTPELIGLAGTFAARAALVVAGELIAGRTSVTVTTQLRRQLLAHALELGPSWLAGERAGELSLLANRGVAALDTYFGRYLPQLIAALLIPVGLLAWVAAVDWVSLLILLALVVLVPVAIVGFGREAAARTGRQWRRLSSLAARYLELVQGLPTLRAVGRAAHGRREVAAATDGLRTATLATLRVAFLSALALELLAGLGVGLVAMVLGLRLLNGSVALSVALAVLVVAPEVFLPLRRAGAEFHASAEGQAAARRILDILDVAAGTNPADPVALPADSRPPTVALERVRFSYPGRGVPALDGLDLAVASGEHVAVLGPSGSGKSTLLWGLLGFLAPEVGRVTVGGVDLRRVDPAQWRRRVAWVPQHPHLFRGTIEENLRMGDATATVSDLRRALEWAGLGELVAQLPRGLDSEVGERGLTLSAGERQRLAIARAVVRDAPLVLFDEPVAHLDALTEAELRHSLGPWLADKSVVVAAHRPELVQRIDRVVHLEGSRGAADGPRRDQVPGPGSAATGVAR